MSDLSRIDQMLLLVAMCVAIETCEQSFYRLAGRNRSRWWFYVTPGIVLHVCGLASWYLLLRIAPLAVALPMIGLQYVTIALMAKLLFNERVDRRRWFGIALIVFGFALIAVYSGEAGPG